MGIHPSSTATAVIDTTYVFRKHSKYTEKMDVGHRFEKSSLCSKCLKPTVNLQAIFFICDLIKNFLDEFMT